MKINSIYSKTDAAEWRSSKIKILKKEEEEDEVVLLSLIEMISDLLKEKDKILSKKNISNIYVDRLISIHYAITCMIDWYIEIDNKVCV
jgi:hypothetical protein